MSTVPQDPATPVTQQPADSGQTPAPTPTTTFYQKNADDFMKALDQVTQIIPKLDLLHPLEADFVKTHLNVPPQFVDTTISIVEQTPELQALKKLDTKATRDALQFYQAFRPVFDKVIAVAQALKDTMDTGFANAAADSFQMYAILKALARDAGAGSAALVVHVKNLRRDLGRRGRPAKVDKPEETPATPGTPPKAEDKSGGKAA